MKEKKTALEAWLAMATGGIRFGPDRAAAERELREHLEDKILDFQRIFPDMPQEEAEDRALAGMGDAGEIGRELARIHRPWLGYLWAASKCLLAGAALAAALLLLNGGIESAWPGWSGSSWLGDGGMEDYVRRSFGPDWAVERRPLPLPEPEVFGEYTFTVVQADLWTAADGEETGGMVYLILEAAHKRPWEGLNGGFGAHLWAEDDRGNRIMSRAEKLEEDPQTWAEAVESGKLLDCGVFRERLEFILELPDRWAERLILRYDRMGADLSIPILLKEGER